MGDKGCCCCCSSLALFCCFSFERFRASSNFPNEEDRRVEVRFFLDVAFGVLLLVGGGGGGGVVLD